MKKIEVATHEAGHAIVGHVLGESIEAARITDGGGECCFDPYRVDSEDKARRYAASLWGGPLAVQLVFGRHIAQLVENETAHGPESDHMILIALADKWGGADPLAWDKARRQEALLILMQHYSALLEAAKRIQWGDRVSQWMPPLHQIPQRTAG